MRRKHLPLLGSLQLYVGIMFFPYEINEGMLRWLCLHSLPGLSPSR